jgi:putative DNA primase/helicase
MPSNLSNKAKSSPLRLLLAGGRNQKLLGELPGILLWAIEGWKRLRDRGRFVQPESGRGLVLQLEELSSPVHQFLKEKCRIGQECDVSIDDLFNAWCRWCADQQITKIGDKAQFGRDLLACVPGLRRKQRRGESGSRSRFYVGLELLGPMYDDMKVNLDIKSLCESDGE